MSSPANPHIAVGPNAFVHCHIDDEYVDPWDAHDDVLMIHGIAEDGQAWAPWVPHLARRHRVLRPDLRGYGLSSPLPAEGMYSIEQWADDLERVLDAVNSTRAHVIAAKLGAQIAFELAQRRNPRIASLTLAGMLPSPSKALGPWLDDWISLVERDGVQAWANATMPGRMAEALTPAAMQWWIAYMGEAPARSVAASLRLLPRLHGPQTPERIACPTLFIVAGDPSTATLSDKYDQRPALSELDALCHRIANATITPINANTFHVAATHPDVCAQTAAAFIDRTNALPRY